MLPAQTHFLRLPFRHKLAALAIATASLSLVLLMLSTSLLVWWAAERSVRHQSDLVRPLLSAALIGPMIERNYATVREIAVAIVQSQAIQELTVYSADGVKVAGERSGPAGLFGTHEVIELAEGSMKFGRVELVLSAGSLADLIGGLLWAMLASIAVSLMLAMLVFRRFAWRMTDRIERLAATARAFSEARFAQRAPENDGDEIGELARAFNRMASDIERQFAELLTAEARQRELADAERAGRSRLEALFSALAEGIAFSDLEGRVQMANPALRRIGRLPSGGNPVGMAMTQWLAAAGLQPVDADVGSEALVASGGCELRGPDGREYVETSLPVRVEGQLIGHLWVYDDVTERRRALRELAWLSERDTLTGLFNRRAFAYELERRFAELERQQQALALISIDLDDFREINDSFGHAGGDAILLRVSRHLAQQLPPEAVLARFGGDGFAVAVWVDDEDAALALGRDLLQALRTMPLSYDDRSLHLTASVGVAVAPQHGTTPEQLGIAAESALHRVKTSGRNGLRLFETNARVRGILRLGWKERLIDALENDLFELYFQGVWYPDRRLSHAEVLLRLCPNDGDEAPITPGQFISHAESYGIILDIDRLVFRKAVAVLALQPELRLAVNISGRTVEAGDFVGYARQVLAAAGVKPERIIVEITETAAVGDLANARTFIAGLRELGCLLALDDFGAGYSSFAYLKHLRADLVKIDGQFVRGIHLERENQIFVRAIAEAAKLISGGTVAEFVENEVTAELLPRLGVTLMQGYWFDEPAPLQQFLQCIEGTPSRPG